MNRYLCREKKIKKEEKERAQGPRAFDQSNVSIRSHSTAGCVVPGAGAMEVAASMALHSLKTSVHGRARLGVQAFADALLVIPKILAQNSGFDAQETIVKLQVRASYVPTRRSLSLC